MNIKSKLLKNKPIAGDEQLNFHTIIQGSKKDRQWNDIKELCFIPDSAS